MGQEPGPGATVCFLRQNGKVLLQQRAPGRRWAGRLNGPGGKVDAGETPEAAIVREVAEETGLRINHPVARGTLDLIFGDPPSSQLRVFVFTCASFTGRARGGKEGSLRWYAEPNLPFDQLWPDMRYWLPAILDGGTVDGTCVFDEAGDYLLACSLRVALDTTGLRDASWSGAGSSHLGCYDGDPACIRHVVQEVQRVH